MAKPSSRESALNIAEKKSVREQREICVHRNGDIYHVTPEEKAGDNVEELELVETFEPENTQEGSNFERVRVNDFSSLESGMRIVVNREDVETVTEVSSRQIVTNVGNKFRKSDGVEWGGGEKEITHKLIKKNNSNQND